MIERAKLSPVGALRPALLLGIVDHLGGAVADPHSMAAAAEPNLQALIKEHALRHGEVSSPLPPWLIIFGVFPL